MKHELSKITGFYYYFHTIQSSKLFRSEKQNFILTTLSNSILESLLVDKNTSEISMSTQLQVKDKNTLNWMAKCSVAKTFSLHSNKLEMVSNNTQSASQLGGEKTPFIIVPLTAMTETFNTHMHLWIRARTLGTVHANTNW